MPRRASIIIDAVDRASPTFLRLRTAVGALGAAAAAAGAVQIGRYLVDGLAAAVKASAEQETAERKLAQALVNTGQNVAKTLPGLRAYADALQRQTGYADEQILANQSLLVSIGKLSGEGLERATKAALDLAAATGTDLEAAFKLIGKAAAGETGTLARYGIILDDNVPKSERFAAALEKIESQFGGQAGTGLETFEGQVKQLGIAFGELQEVIGGPLREVSTAFLGSVLNPLIQDTTDAAAATDKYRDAVFGAARALGTLGLILEAGLRSNLFTDVLATKLREFEQGAKFLESLPGRVSGGLSDLAASVSPLAAGFQGLAVSTADAGSAAQTSELYFVRFLAALDKAQADKSGIPSVVPSPQAVDDDLAAILSSVTTTARAIEAEIAQTSSELESLWTSDISGLAGAVEAEIASTAETLDELIVSNVAAMAGAIETAIEETAKLEDALLSVSETVSRTFKGELVDAALDFSGTLVDAAFGAKIVWKEFFRSLLADIARAIVQAIVLRAILAATGWGSFLGFAGGGQVASGRAPVRAAAGFMVPGPANRGDSVPAFLRPGELVLNRDQQRELLGRGGGGPVNVRVELAPNMRAWADLVSVEVERGGARLVATETVRPIRDRRA